MDGKDTCVENTLCRKHIVFVVTFVFGVENIFLQRTRYVRCQSRSLDAQANQTRHTNLWRGQIGRTRHAEMILRSSSEQRTHYASHREHITFITRVENTFYMYTNLWRGQTQHVEIILRSLSEQRTHSVENTLCRDAWANQTRHTNLWRGHMWREHISYRTHYVRHLVCSLCQIRSLDAWALGWLRLVGSLRLQVSFAKEPYRRDYILQKSPIFLRSLLLVATPYKICVSRLICPRTEATTFCREHILQGSYYVRYQCREHIMWKTHYASYREHIIFITRVENTFYIDYVTCFIRVVASIRGQMQRTHYTSWRTHYVHYQSREHIIQRKTLHVLSELQPRCADKSNTTLDSYEQDTIWREHIMKRTCYTQNTLRMLSNTILDSYGQDTSWREHIIHRTHYVCYQIPHWIPKKSKHYGENTL